MKFTLAASFAALSAFPALVAAGWDLSTKNNLLAYWGQNGHGSYNSTDDKQQRSLVEYCQDTNVDAFSIGFVNWWAPDGKTLTINVSNACTGWQRFNHPRDDLLYCPSIEQDIITCQKVYGKKIFISVGGGESGDPEQPKYDGFASNQRALDFAYTLWKTFGGGWTYYRPFGEAVVDGFDLNIEYGIGGSSARYAETARILRRLMDNDQVHNKQWFLTGAPQCSNPDNWLADPISKVKFDALFVQFYNGNCGNHNWKSGQDQLDNSKFNFGLWDQWASTKSANKDVKIFLGAVLGGNLAPWGGYVSRTTLVNIAKDVAKKYPKRFGGVMLWDISEADTNTGYVREVRKGLDSIQSSIKKRDITPVVDFLRRRNHRHGRKI